MHNGITKSSSHSTASSQLRRQGVYDPTKAPFDLNFFALAAALWVLLGSASICDAANFTGRVDALSFPNGTVVDTLALNNQCIHTITVTAPATLTMGGVTYEFLFWNIDAQHDTAQTVTFKPGCGINNDFAWYLPLGSGCAPEDNCPPGVATWAFSLNKNQVIAKAPIEQVWPKSAWTGPPSSFVSTDTSPKPVTIEARPKILPYGRFDGWELLPSDSISTREFKVDAGSSAYAIAFYSYPDPDPCTTYRNEIFRAEVSIGCISIPAFPSCQLLVKKLRAELNACEIDYGE